MNTNNQQHSLEIARPTRRSFLAAGSTLGALALTGQTAQAMPPKQRKFTLDYCPGRIGVQANQTETISLASKHGFESVEPLGGQIADYNAGQRSELIELLKQKKLVWGAAGLPVEFRKDEKTFEQGVSGLARIAGGLKSVGVTRVGTWLMPNHDSLTYLANFKQHAKRLKKVGQILGEFDLRLGLEYVGPRTLWSSRRYPFLHSMAETMELLDAIGESNVGLVLDSWHWYTAEETVDQLKSLRNEQVVAVDLNDAPAGIDVRDQIDNRRALPMATGVIDMHAFMDALVAINYDGPIRAEPFSQELNALDNEPATAQTAAAMKKAFALVD